MALLGISTFLRGAVLVTNAIMQAYGHPNRPVVHMLASGAVRLAVVYWLAGIPSIGILGVPMGIALCNLSIMVLNILAIRRCVPGKPRIASNLLRSLLPAAIMGAAAWGCWWVLGYIGITSRLLLCGIPLGLAVIVYVICAVLCKSITKEDCLLLPKGAKIAKLLHL